MTGKRKKLAEHLIIYSLVFLIFYLDSITPRGYTFWVLYVVPLYLSARPDSRINIILLYVICASLLFLGVFFEAPGIPLQSSIINRLVSILIGWIIFSLINSNKRQLKARTSEILERKRVEEQLRESEEKFRVIFERSPLGIFRSSPEGKIFEVNQEFAEIFGYQSPQQVLDEVYDVGKQLYVHEARRREIVSDVLKGVDVKRYENVYRKRDGSLFTANLYLRSVKDSQGKLLYLEGVVDDITERKRVEEALRESQEMLRLVLDTIPVSVFWKDRESRFVGCNREFAQKAGLRSPDDLKGKSDYDMVWKAQAGLYQADDRKVMESGLPKINYEESQTTPGGGLIWLQTSKIPLRDAGGEIKGILGTFEDITVRKQGEELLKRDKQVIEKLVRKRTEELIEAQLELERSKRLSDIGTLAATVAHELRNPLAAIDMASHNIKKKADKPILNRHLATIEKKVAESDQIINNLLFYSRLKTPHIEAVNIYELLTDIIKNAKARLPETIAVELEVDPIKKTVIEADSLQIKEVFANIFNNAADAVRHIDKGKIAISAAGDDGAVTVKFKDNGVGMSRETLEKATEPFYTTKAKGTGLGLTVSRQIIDLHNGTITLESESGKGTTVIVRLPASAK